jgi:hypothetical protein
LISASFRALAARLSLAASQDASGGNVVPDSRELLTVAAALIAAVAIVFHAQLRSLFLVPDFGDPLFSMWRLGWVAQQIIADPGRLFEANIFYPEASTLALSDSILLPAVVAAPLLWSGVPVSVAYNLLLLAALISSGMAAYVLARALTLRPSAAWVAALIFALHPFRLHHYSHLEMQMTPWMPLALLAAHRLLRRRHPRYAVLFALALSAQWYSSMYYGLFLTIYATTFVCVLGVAWRTGWRPVASALAGLVAGVLLALPLATAYRATQVSRGTRSEETVRQFSARPIEYLQPTKASLWYQDVHVVRRETERELFPNVVPLALGAVGLIPPWTGARFAVVAAGIVAFDGSLGFNGLWYPAAYSRLSPMKSMRAPARFAILVGLSLSLLAGFGAQRLLRLLRSSRASQAGTALITAAFIVEALPDLHLRRVWSEPPPLYATLGANSGAVLFEYPIHPDPAAFGENLPYMYFSTWHWTKMVNGYSGSAPESYARLARETAGFPLGHSVAFLQDAGVTHVTLHCALWYRQPCEQTKAALDADARFRLITSGRWENEPAFLYELHR